MPVGAPLILYKGNVFYAPARDLCEDFAPRDGTIRPSGDGGANRASENRPILLAPDSSQVFDFSSRGTTLLGPRGPPVAGRPLSGRAHNDEEVRSHAAGGWKRVRILWGKFPGSGELHISVAVGIFHRGFFRVLIKALESPGAAVHLYLGFGRRDGLDVGVPSVAGGILRKQSRHFFRQFFVGGKTFEFVLNRKLFKYLLEHGGVHRTLRGIFDGRTPAFKNIIVFLIRCFSGVRQDDIFGGGAQRVVRFFIHRGSVFIGEFDVYQRRICGGN